MSSSEILAMVIVCAVCCWVGCLLGGVLYGSPAASGGRNTAKKTDGCGKGGLAGKNSIAGCAGYGTAANSLQNDYYVQQFGMQMAQQQFDQQFQQQQFDEASRMASTPFSMGGLDLSQDAINPCNDFGAPGFGSVGGFDGFGGFGGF